MYILYIIIDKLLLVNYLNYIENTVKNVFIDGG